MTFPSASARLLRLLSFVALASASLACEEPPLEPGRDAGPAPTYDANIAPALPWDASAGNPTTGGLTAGGLGGGASTGGTGGGIDAGAPSMLPCDVSAILSQHCANCHGSTTNFGAPMPLVSWEDLQRKSARTPDRSYFQLVLERVKNDASPMPPAPNGRLSSAQVASLERWVTQGAPKGTQTCMQPAPGGDGGTSLNGAVVPKPADCQNTYELKAHGGSSEGDQTPFQISSNPSLEGNQYQCFYFKPPYQAGAGMLWFESILDNTPRLHHWILYATDNATHAPGTSAGCNAAQNGSYFVVGWAPGATNEFVANDVMLELPSGPNAGLILEVHYYNDTRQSATDASGVRFCTGPANTRPHLAGVHTLGTEGICVEPNTRGHEVKGTCVPAPSGDVHITGIWPHMHQQARRMKVTINRQNGSSEVIHDAPFDFNAQIYHPKTDVVVHPGDTIDTHCFYDNDGAQQIHYGERTQDEMCYAFTTAWPAGALTPAGGGTSGGGLLNRCADLLSILDSCNGIFDAPANAEHPP
jgi:mono/diheme cytochrome c family protein